MRIRTLAGHPIEELLSSRLGKAAAVAGAVPSALAARAALPALLTDLANWILEKLPGVKANIEDIDLNLWRGRVIIKGVLASPADSGGLQLDASIREIAVALEWKSLLRGGLVMDIVIDRPLVYASLPDPAKAKAAATAPSHPNRRSTDVTWQQQLRAMVPFKINRLVIRDGEAHLANAPGQNGVDLGVQGFNLMLRNFTNSEKLSQTLKTSMELEARLMDSGLLQCHAEGYPLADKPTANVDAELKGLDLRQLSGVAEQEIGTEIRAGRLDLFFEGAAAKGRYKGYLKPVIDGMDVEKRRGSGFLDAVKTVMIKGFTKLFRNRHHGRIATRVAFAGKFENTRVNYGQAVRLFLRNAFWQALTPRLENSIGFSRETTEQADVEIKHQRPGRVARFMEILKESISRWSAHQIPRMSAALAYYTAFSIAPLLVLVIAIVGLVYGKRAAQGQVVAQISGLVGPQSAHAIQSMIHAASRPAAGTIATIISIVSLLAGASGVLTELKDVLNRIWGVAEPSGVGALIRQRLLSFAMVLAIGFLLLVSLVISAAMAAAGKYLGGVLPIPEFVLHAVNALVSFGVITVLFALFYKILPDAPIRWRDVWVGSAVTAFLFTVGKILIGLYLGKASVSSSYGAAGSVLVVLLWVYYSALILYLGAEFTKVYAEKRTAPPEEEMVLP